MTDPTTSAYPVTVRAQLDEPLHRWLWLVKWLLAVPHVVVLVLLWIAFFLMTIVAGFSILFTGRYPRGIFDFNVGVMRWTWRVQLYAFSLATDRYPPFSLQRDPSYPAELEVEYPHDFLSGASKTERKGKIFIDWLRNGRGSTSVASWSLRARKGAPVAVPLRWEDLAKIKKPDEFDIVKARQRAAKLRKDPWEGMARLKQKLPKFG